MHVVKPTCIYTVVSLTSSVFWFGFRVKEGGGGVPVFRVFPHQGAASVASQPGCIPFLPLLCMSDKGNTKPTEILEDLKISANIFIIDFMDSSSYGPTGSAFTVYILLYHLYFTCLKFH